MRRLAALALILSGGCLVRLGLPGRADCTSVDTNADGAPDYYTCSDGCFLVDADGDQQLNDRACREADGCYTLDLQDDGVSDFIGCGNLLPEADGFCGAPELNVVGVYEAISEVDSDHPLGNATVLIERRAPQVLALTSYEPVHWTVLAEPEAQILKIVLSGYYDQSLTAPPGIPVERNIFVESGEFLGCGYQFPDQDPTSGCATPRLLGQLEERLGLQTTSFSGCYNGSFFRLREDLSTEGVCRTESEFSGFTDPDCTHIPNPRCHAWQPFNFALDPSVVTPCTGERFVSYNPQYETFVGAILCTEDEYKLVMSDTLEGPYYSIGDYAGHGQDHCELVNPSFTLPSEDDITSGGCETCAANVGTKEALHPVGAPGFSRANFGDPFAFEVSWPEFNLYTSHSYRCGVSIREQSCEPSGPPGAPPIGTLTVRACATRASVLRQEELSHAQALTACTSATGAARQNLYCEWNGFVLGVHTLRDQTCDAVVADETTRGDFQAAPCDTGEAISASEISRRGALQNCYANAFFHDDFACLFQPTEGAPEVLYLQETSAGRCNALLGDAPGCVQIDRNQDQLTDAYDCGPDDACTTIDADGDLHADSFQCD